MKNKLIIMGIMILLILTSSIAAFANTETTVTVQADKTEVKAGETFNVILKATCPDGINNVGTTYSYDEDKLELQSSGIVDSGKWLDLGGGKNELNIIYWPKDLENIETITSADMYKFTFKVKEGVATGSTAKISIAETLLDSDAATNSEYNLPAQEVTVTVIDTTTGDGDGEQGNPPAGNGDGEQGNPPTGNGDGEQGNPPTGNGDENTTEQPTVPGTTVVVGGEKDDTTAGKEIPKAGISSIIIIAILVISGLAIVVYKKNQSYRDIK